MGKLKIVGTRGKKRKKTLKFFAFLGATVTAACLFLVYFPAGSGNGNVFAGEKGAPPGTDAGQYREVLSRTDFIEETEGLPGDKLLENIDDIDESIETGMLSEDEREISFGPIGIGPNIKTGDFIDVRLMCADGTDYIVVSKKELMDYNASTGMSVIRVRENELLTLNSAMADRNNIPGVTLYAVRYVDPSLQSAADISYLPNEAVRSQIREREDEFRG
ncbi:MAG: hypothetical protein K5655_03980 [Lachnospiraceae bacterium]|nr:hypothetical protein [Lachnospiraceae bacterium]